MEERKTETPVTEPEETKTRNGRVVSAVKFIPLAVFALMVIVFKLDLLIAAPIATFTALGVYMLLKNERSFDKAFEHGLTATRKITLIFFILMFAYGVAECFMATGVGASLIILALRLGITARTVAVVSILVTCVLSIATGSSWGTFAACAPIFLWLNHLVGGDVLLTLCGVAGGSCFGDNIGMISDVTVLSCGMQDVKIIDRIKHQMAWCCGCLVMALVIFYFAGSHLPNEQGDVQAALNSIPPEAIEALTEKRPSAVLLLEQVRTGVPFYMVIPMLLVIVLSFMGFHTLICLGVGMVSSLVLGFFAGTADLASWLNDLLFGGFSGAGEWVIVMMMWVSAFGGIMNAMNAFAPLSRFFVKVSENPHQLMGWCGVLCLMGNVALADEAAQVATMSPIVRDIVENNVETENEEDAYKLRLRLATFSSSMGIYGSQLIPWHCFPVFFAGIATAVYPIRYFTPIDIISKNYLSFLIVGTALVLTFSGWDRFVPGFGLPRNLKLRPVEPELPLRSGRSLWKTLLFSLITAGIYGAWQMLNISYDIQTIASGHDGKKTRNFFIALFLSVFTLGTYLFIWHHRLAKRIGDELKRRGIDYRFGADSFWHWGVLGLLILVGPFVYFYKLLTAMNLLAKDFNENG